MRSPLYIVIAVAFELNGRAGAALVMGMLELVKRMHTLADYPLLITLTL
jgi:hypothetical protein